MPTLRSDWHRRLNDVLLDFRFADEAVRRLADRVRRRPDEHPEYSADRKRFAAAADALEATFVVRLFAVFEAALRSYDRARAGDPERTRPAAVLIGSTGGRRGLAVPPQIRQRAHEVRRTRNAFAHESDEATESIGLADAKRRCAQFLARLPERW